MSHGVFHRALHRPPVAEAHLGLHGMHVDVDEVGRDHDIEAERRSRTSGHRGAVRLLRRAHDAVIANGAPVDGEEKAPSRRADIAGSLDEAGDVNGAVHVVHRHQAFGERSAPQPGEPALKPCEMPVDKVTAFVLGAEPEAA